MAYEDIRNFLMQTDTFFKDDPFQSPEPLSQPLKAYLQSIQLNEAIGSIRSNSASLATFRVRFFRWFNAFRVIKYLNFSHETWYQKKPIREEANLLQLKLGFHQEIFNVSEMLTFYRNLDRTGFGIN